MQTTAEPALDVAEAAPTEEWYRQDVATVLARLDANVAQGLAAEEVTARLARYGPNSLAAASSRSAWRILAEQFLSTMVIILMLAAGAALVLGDVKDAAVILAIIA